MRMAKATQRDCDCATLVIGMIGDIESGSFPRKPDGNFDESDPDCFDPYDGDDCKVFVERLLRVVGKREHGGSLNRVVFGMITTLGNDVFDPAKDYLDWHPDLKSAVAERERRRQIENTTTISKLIRTVVIPTRRGRAIALFHPVGSHTRSSRVTPHRLGGKRAWTFRSRKELS